ncbi:MAG: orotidine-5'-phosphate decarboxylase, partial [Actinomycetota bacterium]
VAKAATSLESLGIEFLTVHASGGSAMIEGAANALPKTKIVAVTVLTSLDSAELAKLGLGSNVEKTVVNWAQSAIQSGAKAIVASPLEVSALRNALPSDIELITPGIRFESGKDDQARTMSPAEAIAAGADYLVVGRPISGAPNPGQAAQEIFKSVTK